MSNKKPWLPAPGDPVIDVDLIEIEGVEWVPYVGIPALNTEHALAVLPGPRGQPTRQKAAQEAREALKALRDGIDAALIRLNELEPPSVQ